MMETEDYVFRTALESLDASSPSANALTVFMMAKSVLTGQTRFHLEQLLQESALRAIYAELRERQSVLLEASKAQRDRTLQERSTRLGVEHSIDHYWDEDYEEEPVQLGEFEDQVAIDIELLEGLVDGDAASADVVLQNKHLLALTAVIADASVRYEYEEEALISYMFDLMGIRD
jgi:hypothetical protein